MTAARTVVALLVCLFALSGCGGYDKPSASASSPSEATSDPAESIPTDQQTAKSAETIQPGPSKATISGASELTVPKGADFTLIRGFPIPPGATVKDPGPLMDTWQFDIKTDQPDDVIAFYKRVLPQAGYKVRTDVTLTQGYDSVTWDLAFDGKVAGTMARDTANGVVFVVINPPNQTVQ